MDFIKNWEMFLISKILKKVEVRIKEKMEANKNKNFEVASIGELSQQLYCNGRKQSDSCTYTQANAWYAQYKRAHNHTHTHIREKKKKM